MFDRDETFDFTEAEQDAIIGFMFEDTSFFLKCLDYLPPDTFRQATAKTFTQKLYNYYVAEHREAGVVGSITWPEFEGALLKEFSTDIKVMNQYRDFYSKCRASIKSFQVEILANRMAHWMKNVKTRQILHTGRDLYIQRGAPAARELLTSGVQEIQRISFVGDGSFDFSDPRRLYFEEDEVLATKCSTMGHPLFDELLLSGQSLVKHSDMGHEASASDMRSMTRGGLKPGDTTILLGPTNAGKTSAVITVVAANLFMDKNVLLITHEQRDSDIAKKIHTAIVGESQQSIRDAMADETGNNLARQKVRTKMAFATKLIAQKLTYDPWIKAGNMHVEKVINHIRIRQEELVKKTGRGYDLLVVDYPAKLKAMDMQGKKVSMHEEIGHVYNEFLILAKELKLHALLPAQTNREGYKISQAGDDRMVGAGDVAGSFDIARDADNVISINRSLDDADRNMVRFFIDKSRSNKAKMTFVSHTRFDLSRTHWVSQASSELHPGQELSAEVLNKFYPVVKT